MSKYKETKSTLWTGRDSTQQLYLHEKVQLINLEKEALKNVSQKSFALLGYACGEGVKRNQGRIGAADGPDTIRKQLSKMPNHLPSETKFLDAGSVDCLYGDMEVSQKLLSEKVVFLLENNAFPILFGGGHDIAYGHYNGLKQHLGPEKTLGIINFDAHFDLRSNENGNNSGTPFYQIAEDSKNEGKPFHYLALGIRKDANDNRLFETAAREDVTYVEIEDFNLTYLNRIEQILDQFIAKVDYVYVTIDLDGFSSAYAPGVSAPSPMGFSPDIVLKSLGKIIASKKLLSLDLAEMNPKYDIDHLTSKLAASIIHFILHAL